LIRFLLSLLLLFTLRPSAAEAAFVTLPDPATDRDIVVITPAVTGSHEGSAALSEQLELTNRLSFRTINSSSADRVPGFRESGRDAGLGSQDLLSSRPRRFQSLEGQFSSGTLSLGEASPATLLRRHISSSAPH
jgi:hypothetical protein